MRLLQRLRKWGSRSTAKGMTTAAPPTAEALSTASGRVFRVWAQGVGTSFEFLDDSQRWQPIVDPYVINKLGELCAHNSTTLVTYKNFANGQSYRAVQDPDGLIAQTNVRTNAERHIRLVPHFFEFEEGPKDWRPVTDPEALMALSAVLASSLPKRYTYTSATTGYRGSAESSLVDARGLIEQRNVQTQKKRRIRCTPVGPDGAPHFEFHDTKDVWRAVSPCCVKQLAAVAAGRGDAFYSVTHVAGPAKGKTFAYQAFLDESGFVKQRNTETSKVRELRPAPWRGHGCVAEASEKGEQGPRIRVDPTDGYFRGKVVEEAPVVTAQTLQVAVPVMAATPVVDALPLQDAMPVATATTITMTQMPAQSFYSPEEVPMGTAISPVSLQDAGDIPMAQPVYYYDPSVMEPGASALPMGQVL